MTLFFGALAMAALIDGDVIREAMRITGLSIEKAAKWIGMDPRQFERQLDGDGHLRHSALGKLPDETQSWYHFLMLLKKGAPREVKRGVPIILGLMASKRIDRASRQIKMQLNVRQKRQAS